MRSILANSIEVEGARRRCSNGHDWGLLRGKPLPIAVPQFISVGGLGPCLRVPRNIRARNIRALRLCGVEFRVYEFKSALLIRSRGGDFPFSPSPRFAFFIEEPDYFGHPNREIRNAPLTNSSALIRICQVPGFWYVYRAYRIHCSYMGTEDGFTTFYLYLSVLRRAAFCEEFVFRTHLHRALSCSQLNGLLSRNIGNHHGTP